MAIAWQDVLLRGVGDLFGAMQASAAVYGFALATIEKHFETVESMGPWLRAWALSRRVVEADKMCSLRVADMCATMGVVMSTMGGHHECTPAPTRTLSCPLR